MVAVVDRETCRKGTENFLCALGNLGYQASAKKSQICMSQVIYLQYALEGGQRWLSDAQKETGLKIAAPKTVKLVREFLGTVGLCRLWIPGLLNWLSLCTRPPKNTSKFTWMEEKQKVFDTLKQKLLEAPVLGLPDINKPFYLFIDENEGIAKGVLTQTTGPWKRPVAYLSKKLDPVAAGWSPCLPIIIAVAMLVKDADKLILGQNLTIVIPHAMEAVLKLIAG